MIGLIALEWYLPRIKEEAQLETFWNIVQEEFRTFIGEMLEEALECISALEEEDKALVHDDVKPLTNN